MAGEDARDLAAFVRTRSGEAFERLARRYAGLVHAACRRRLGHAADAEDASQAVFLALARKARSVRPERLGSWLHGAAARASAFVLRSRARRARHEEEAGRMRALGRESRGPDWSAARPHLDAELAELPAKLREAVARHYLAGQTRARIARELGVAEGTVASRCAAGIERLRRRLARRGALLSAAALVPLLLAEAKAAAPAALLASLPALASGTAEAVASGGAGASANLIAKGVIKMMFWAKVKVCAAALAAAAVVGTGTGVALTGAHAGETGGKLRKEKDNKGREWQLEDWKEGTRPYTKDLAKREAEYRKKWGEDWDGPRHGDRILTPGTWRYEVVAELPEPLASKLWVTKNEKRPHHHGRWGGAWPMPDVFAPGGGQATDLYATATIGFVHCNLKTKKVTFIGKLEGLPGNTEPLGERGALNISGRPSKICTIDKVTGRVYFKAEGKPPRLRYVEKLLPYTDKAGGKEVLLPAILDYKEMYKQVKGPGGGDLEPAIKDGVRAVPRFAVHTVRTLKHGISPGTLLGSRPLLTPDGKGIYLTNGRSVYGGSESPMGGKPSYLLDVSNLHDIATGRVIAPVKMLSKQPQRNPGNEGGCGGTCLGLDGVIYVAQHGGCGNHAARMFSLDPRSGKLTILYASAFFGKAMGIDRKVGGKDVIMDGPADALNLLARSTLYQTQCPRTGAILNGGWDASGVRRYHDGFVTSVWGSMFASDGRKEWGWTRGQKKKNNGFYVNHHNCEPAIAPNGDLYLADSQVAPQRFLRVYRTDWPKEQPEYGYGEKFMPKAKLEELMLEYCKNYIANYAELSRIY